MGLERAVLYTSSYCSCHTPVYIHIRFKTHQHLRPSPAEEQNIPCLELLRQHVVCRRRVIQIAKRGGRRGAGRSAVSSSKTRDSVVDCRDTWFHKVYKQHAHLLPFQVHQLQQCVTEMLLYTW